MGSPLPTESYHEASNFWLRKLKLNSPELLFRSNMADSIEIKETKADENSVNMEEKIIKTAKCGLLKVFVQGEIESRDFKRKSKAVFLTVHDLGSNYKSIVRFVN